MTTPQVLANIITENGLKKNKFMIPYYAKGDKVYRVHVLEVNGAKNKSEATESATVLDSATDAFITHFFPEYYPFVMEGERAILASLMEEIESFKPHYETLRGEIRDSLTVKKAEKLLPIPGMNPRLKVVVESTIDFVMERLAAQTADRLPPLAPAIDVFAEERNVEGLGDQTSFNLSTMPNAIEKLSGTLTSFGDFARGAQNIMSVPLDFNSMQTGTSQIVNLVLQTVYDSIRSNESDSPPQAYDTDFITVYFDDNLMHPKIVYIEYMVLNVTGGDTELATVGFISNVKYDPKFRDPLTMAILKNHEQILQNSAQSSGLSQQSSITQFFKSLGMGTNPTFSPQLGDIPGSLTPGNNIFGNRSADDLIDLNDIQKLDNLFNTIMTPEEVQQLEKSAQDPKIKKRILQKQKATKLKAGIQTVKVIDDILNFNFPLFGPNLSKEGRAVNAVLSQFGIQELAKEALICLTLGLGATASRITQSVKNSIVESASSLRKEPLKPSKELNIERPTLAMKLKDPAAYFSVSGDPPIGQQIKDIILNALANAGFEVIKSLAEMIQFN